MIHLQFFNPQGKLICEKSHLKCPVTIGTAKNADVKLNDESLSQFHAQILLDGNALIVQDTGSEHGIFRDGQRRSEMRFSGETLEFYIGRIGVRLIRNANEPQTKAIPELASIVAQPVPQKLESFWHTRFEKNLLRKSVPNKTLLTLAVLSTLSIYPMAILSESTQITSLILNLVSGIGLALIAAIGLCITQYFLHKQTRFWESFAISYIILMGLVSPIYELSPLLLYNIGPNFFTLSIWPQLQFLSIILMAFLAHSYLFQQSRRRNLAFFYAFLWSIPIFTSSFKSLKDFEASAQQSSITREGAAVYQLTHRLRTPSSEKNSVESFIGNLDKRFQAAEKLQVKAQ